jgi:hypothetical protein
VNTQTPTTHHHKCGDEVTCPECASGQRNRFFKGKRLRAEEFRLEQAYGITRRRLINRSVLGWGVVRGFSLHQDPATPLPFRIGGGFALDRHGRELLLVEPAAVSGKNTFIAASGQTGCDVKSIDTIEQTAREDALEYLLQAHYAERRFGDVPQLDACGCDPPEQNFTCETVVFSLTPLAHGRCPCAEGDCTRTCKCRYRHAADDQGAAPGAGPHDATKDDAQKQAAADPSAAAPREPDPPNERPCGERGRGPHDCLCQWVTEAAEPQHPGTLCGWRGYCLDPGDGVPLGCVKVWKKPKADPKQDPKRDPKKDPPNTPRDCDVIVIELTGGCDPRRLVKNNDLLYDLIRGCDLTRISKTSWQAWHRSGDAMPWQTFYDMFFATALPQPQPGEKPPVEIPTQFVVSFSGLVRRDTLRRDAVIMTAITVEKDSKWLVAKRVPLAKLDATPSSSAATTDPDLTDQVRLVVRYGWIHDELLEASGSDFADHDFVIEMEVRGDLITDCHGQSLDANPAGIPAAPSGNGTPGGTYISSFPVKRKPDSPYDRGTW